jgi:hypothetical protein
MTGKPSVEKEEPGSWLNDSADLNINLPNGNFML